MPKSPKFASAVGTAGNTKRSVSAPKPEAPLAPLLGPNSLRWVFDPDHPAYVARIEWQPRGAAEAVVHPVARRSAPSVTALALACLCRGIALSGEAAPLERSGGLAVEEHGTWWTIRATKAGGSFLETLGTAYENLGANNTNAATALKRLKADRDGWRGFGDFWKASQIRAEHFGSFSIRLPSPTDVGHSAGGPTLAFRLLGADADVSEPARLLKLAREMEARFEKWTPLLNAVRPRHRRPASPDPEVLRRYLEKVVQQTENVILAGLDHEANDPTKARRLQLADLFVDLTTSLRRKARPGERSGYGSPAMGSRELGREGVSDVPVGVFELCSTHDRCVITGRPGSGKTTCIRFLSFCHARQGLVPEQLPLERLRHWSGEWLMPIVVELRYFARQLPREIEPRSLWDFFKRTTLQGNCMEDLEPALATAAANGRALVIFEGLDEVPTGAQRLLVHQAIREFAECPQFKASRIVVTCRTRAYRGDLVLPGFKEAPLEDFSPAKIREFTRAWYRAHAPLRNLTDTDAAQKADDLHEAIQEPALAAQAGVPMMLTVMANVHTKNNKLPRDRAVVYDQMVRILIDNWDNARLGDSAPLRRLLDGAKKTENDLLRLLRRLAFEAHSSGRSLDGSLAECADLSKHGPQGLLEQFRTFCGSLDRAEEFLEAIEQRAGLLISPDPGSGIYTFPHRSFQEYLAGSWLADMPDFVQVALGLVREDETVRTRGDSHARRSRTTRAVDSGYWDEVLKWAAGWTAHVNDSARLWRDIPDLATDLVACPTAPPSPVDGHHRLTLGAEILAEMGADKLGVARGGDDCIKLYRRLLLEQATQPSLPSRLRGLFGLLLGNMGDDRPGAGTAKSPNGVLVPVIDWKFIVPSPFRMGGKKDDLEQPVFRCELVREAFYVSAYPVTVMQYSAFVADGGYEREEYWSPEGWVWVQKKGDDGKRMRTGPERYAPAFQTANHPQVGVSWYEADAYCAWLTAILQGEAVLPDGRKVARIRLPTEAEWELAARGPGMNNREYPWGDETDLEGRCNYSRNIGHTSAVGIFPLGNTPEGVSDMSGNVFEWCATKGRENYEDYADKVDHARGGIEARVLRGGSWHPGSDLVRGAYRDGNDPDARSYFVGFRLAASPSL